MISAGSPIALIVLEEMKQRVLRSALLRGFVLCAAIVLMLQCGKRKSYNFLKTLKKVS